MYFEYISNTIQVQFKYSSNAIHIQFKYHLNTIQIHNEYISDTLPTLLRFQCNSLSMLWCALLPGIQIQMHFDYNFSTLSNHFQYLWSEIRFLFFLEVGEIDCSGWLKKVFWFKIVFLIQKVQIWISGRQPDHWLKNLFGTFFLGSRGPEMGHWRPGKAWKPLQNKGFEQKGGSICNQKSLKAIENY